MRKYGNIEFADGYNEPFATFKEKFENAQVFKDVSPEDREAELLKAHKIATGKGLITREDIFTPELLAEIETIKQNGNIPATTNEVKTNDPAKTSKRPL